MKGTTSARPVYIATRAAVPCSRSAAICTPASRLDDVPRSSEHSRCKPGAHQHLSGGGESEFGSSEGRNNLKSAVNEADTAGSGRIVRVKAGPRQNERRSVGRLCNYFNSPVEVEP